MSRYLQAGIDVGSHQTRVVVAQMKNRKSTPEIVGVGSAPTRGVRNGYVVAQNEAVDSISEAFAAAEKAAGVKIKKAIVGIGGITLESETSSGSVIISRVDSEVTEVDIARVAEAAERNIDLTNKKVIHRFPISYRLDGKEVLGQPGGMRGVKLEATFLFVTSLAQHLDALITAVEKTGREVEDIAAAPLAASLATLTRPQQAAGCVFADIGAETVSLAVFENEQLISVYVFQIGSTSITNDIALGLQLPLEDAEEIKLKTFTATPFFESEADRKQLEEIVSARMRDIFELIQSHLKKLRKNGLLPAGIILSGGGLLEITTLEDLARNSLGLPARAALPRRIPSAEKYKLNAAWAVATGVCMLGLDPAYASELYGTNQPSVSGILRRVLNWGKQFLP